MQLENLTERRHEVEKPFSDATHTRVLFLLPEEFRLFNMLYDEEESKKVPEEFMARLRAVGIKRSERVYVCVFKIEERKKRFVLPETLEIIDKVLDGDFDVPNEGIVKAFNAWVSGFYHGVKTLGTLYLCIVGYRPVYSTHSFGVIMRVCDDQGKPIGYGRGVRGFTAYEFALAESEQSPEPEAEEITINPENLEEAEMANQKNQLAIEGDDEKEEIRKLWEKRRDEAQKAIQELGRKHAIAETAVVSLKHQLETL